MDKLMDPIEKKVIEANMFKVCRSLTCILPTASYYASVVKIYIATKIP
jgi:hypothetical protein